LLKHNPPSFYFGGQAAMIKIFLLSLDFLLIKEVRQQNIKQFFTKDILSIFILTLAKIQKIYFLIKNTFSL